MRDEDGYDAADDCRKSYDVAIGTLRDNLAAFRCERIGAHRLYLGDCREIMPLLGGLDAVVTDPPYGINAARDRKSQKHGWRDYDAPGWDRERPSGDLIAKIAGMAKNSIIWGGNYFTDVLSPTGKWLSWDKGQTDFSLADFELAWCSFEGAARRILYPRALAMKDGKEHPTQKPLGVMQWCLRQLPKPSKVIFDPFMGSGTTGVACERMDRQFVGIEIEPTYFDIACRRIDEEVSAPRLFTEPEQDDDPQSYTLFGD